MGKYKKWFGLLLVLLLAALAACSGGTPSQPGGGTDNSGNTAGEPQQKEVIRLRVGSGHPVEGATWIRMIKEYFIPEVNKALESTNYQIEWTEAFGGTVAKLGEELEAIESNLLDIGFIVSPFEPSKLLLTNIGYNTPFSSPDPVLIGNVANRLVEKYPEFRKEYEQHNQRLLGLGFTESYELITNFPVNTIEDLKGQKIAAAGPNLEWIKPIGAVPVQGGLTDAYQSFQTGVYNGWIMYSRSTLGFKLYEQAKYFTKVGFGSVIVGALSINENTWQKLPKEVQDVIAEVGQNYSYAMAEELKNETASNLKKLEEQGAVITELPQAEREKWLAKLPNQPNEYAKRLNEAGLPGSQIMREYIQGQIDGGYQFPIEYQID